MADISKIQLPNNTVYDIKDANAAKIGVVEYGVSTYQEVLEAYENNDTIICVETQSSSSSGAVDVQVCFILDTVYLIHPPDPFFEFCNNNYTVKITYGDVWSRTPIRRLTSVGLQNQTNGGLSISDSPITTSQGTISIGHSNVLSSAQTTSGIYPIKIDKNGHISEYGSAVTIPTKVSDLTNDSGYITGYTETDPTVPSWAKAANKPSYNAEEIALDSPWTYDGNVISTAEEALNYLDDNKLSSETDPVFTASAAYGISSSDITNWNGKTSNIGTITSVKTTAGAHTTINKTSGAVEFNVPTKTSHLTNDSGFVTSSGITGSGTTNKIPKFTSASAIGDGYGVTDNSSNTDVTSSDTNLITGRTLYYQLAKKGYTTNTGTVTSVRVQATSPVSSSTSTAQSSTLNTTISLSDAYGDTKNPYGTKTANYILAGPSSGSAAAPSFRALVAADIPDLSSTYQAKLTSTTASLTTAGWSSNAQTVSVSGVTASNTVIVAPAPSSLEDYTTAGIYCSAQASGTLTFTCKTVPASALTVNVLIM